PFQDQWYAVGEDLYLASARGGVPLGHFFQAHNDHRIVPTRLLAFALFSWDRQWDVRLQMTVNALLAGALVFPLLALCRPWFPDPALVGVAALMAWFYSLPVLYENALWGFQSQFYFLILFSLTHVVLVLGRTPFSAGWWLGLAAGAAAILSMRSGLLAPAAVAMVAGWRAIREPGKKKEWAPTLAAAVFPGLAGWALQPSRAAAAAGFDPGAFLHTVVHALAFPQREFSAAGLLLWLPFAALLGIRFFSRTIDRPERVLLAAGAWVLLQAFAMGYARPERGQVLANRYGEILVVGLVVNLAAGACIHRWLEIRASAPTGVIRGKRFWQGALIAFFAGWLAFAGWQARRDAQIFRSVLEPMMVSLRDEQVARIRSFYHGNRAAITEAVYPHIPVIDAPSLVRDLGFPELADVMPFELRNPIPLVFAEGGRPPLANAVPASLPNEPGALHRGTFFKDAGVTGTCDESSAPAVKHPGRRLLFKIAGDFKAGETELQIRGAQGTAVVITDLKSDTLTPVIVPVPGDRFRVEIVDRSPARGIAFLEPVEIGPLSEMALRTLSGGRRVWQIGWLGLGLLGLLSVATALSSPSRRAV
ncbi:MAG: hypothetical protein JWM88_2906, partial [Verrucomicrobia bacterium]|nr:hypothetical protein [Verrucomicrobiota bacterium]